MSDRNKFVILAAVFVLIYFLPLGNPRVSDAVLEAFRLLQWYAVNHTLQCVVPAMFIAGALSVFLSPGAVMRHLGPRAGRFKAYAVASVAGTILAVCSCSVLPMFAGIYGMGAGLGPASAFLYSGPAINVMAVLLSVRVLGLEIGITRALGAVLFAVVIGLLMHAVFRRSEGRRERSGMHVPAPPSARRPAWKTALFFTGMILVLVFSDWYDTGDSTTTGFVAAVHGVRWYLAGLAGLAVLAMSVFWLRRDEVSAWLRATLDFGLMIVPLLFLGIFVTGFVGGLLPEKYVAGVVGGNSPLANLAAAFLGMAWYFATLTEIPIVEMLTKLGMGRGPALSLLLAGPALSVPSILVVSRVIGPRRTAVFCALTVAMSALVGWLFGLVFV